MATPDFAEPPSPKNILRGHKSSVHATCFLRDNQRLASGDSDGHVVLWDLTIMRPRAVWRAHEGAILGISGWGRDKIITHGRDHKLIIWQLGAADEDRLSQTLPVEDVPVPRPQPWVLHLLEVNTMNFCSFAACAAFQSPAHDIGNDAPEEIFIAVPNTLLSEAVSPEPIAQSQLHSNTEKVDVYQLPSQQRLHTIKTGPGFGMAMSLAINWKAGSLTMAGAFENGYTSVHVLQPSGEWTMTYQSQAHTQPVLSMMIHPSLDYFVTCGADDIIAKHPVPIQLQTIAVSHDTGPRVVEVVDEGEGAKPPLSTKIWDQPLKQINTKHAGQQGLAIRSDGRIFATAGWDNKARVYSCKTLKELAVLEWHKVGCYSIAFPDLRITNAPKADSTSEPTSNQNRAMAAITKGRSLVKDRRLEQATSTHWLAVGAKDGKLSLWDIY